MRCLLLIIQSPLKANALWAKQIINTHSSGEGKSDVEHWVQDYYKVRDPSNSILKSQQICKIIVKLVYTQLQGYMLENLCVDVWPQRPGSHQQAKFHKEIICFL